MKIYTKNNILNIDDHVINHLGLEFIIKNYYNGYYVDNLNILVYIHHSFLETYKQRECFMESFKNIIYYDKKNVGTHFIELHPNFIYAELEFFTRLKEIYPTINLYDLKKKYLIDNILCYYNIISDNQHKKNITNYINSSDNESNNSNISDTISNNSNISDNESNTDTKQFINNYRPAAGDFSFIYDNKPWREALTYDYSIIDNLHTDNSNYGIIGWEYLKKNNMYSDDIEYDYIKFTHDIFNSYDNGSYPVYDDLYEKLFHITQLIKMYPCHTLETRNESFKHMLYIAKYGWNRYVDNYMIFKYPL